MYDPDDTAMTSTDNSTSVPYIRYLVSSFSFAPKTHNDNNVTFNVDNIRKSYDIIIFVTGIQFRSVADRLLCAPARGPAAIYHRRPFHPSSPYLSEYRLRVN